MYYSLRILHQLLRASVYPAHITKADAAPPRSFITTQDNQAVMRLLSVLDTLPSIIDFSSPPIDATVNGDNATSRERWKECLAGLISEFQDQGSPLQSYHAKTIERQSPKPAPTTNRQTNPRLATIEPGARVKSKVQPLTKAKQTTPKSKNPYDLLMESPQEGW
jgi:hypothetical protein